MMVLLMGKRGASITVEIRKKLPILPPEVTFTATPPTITLGETSTLTWSSTNADTVSIDQGIGEVALNGTHIVTTTETTTYTIIATGPGGTTTKSTTVTVYLPPTVNISADPETIEAGDSSTLAWTSTNADSCVIEPGIGSVDTSGSITVSPTETTTYTITVEGAGGTATDNVTVTVTYPVPTVTISADPETIQVGESSTLSWSSTYADSATIDQGIGSVDTRGSITVSTTQTTTYTITVEGAGGTATDSVQVVVIAPPEDMDYGLDTDEQQGGGGLVGEMIRILNGNMVEYRTDLQFLSPNRLGLSLMATYNSRYNILGSLGYGWTHTYEASLNPGFVIGGSTYIKIVNQTGRAHYFEDSGGGLYRGVFNERTYVRAEAGGYVWYQLDGTKYSFLASGQLTWIDDAAGNRLEFTYDTNDRLETVTDTASGRVLTFNYNIDGRLTSITGPITDAVPDGIWVTYGYDSNQNLASVTYEDGSGFDYFYTDPNDVNNLTEKRNKAGHLLNTWGYDDQNKAIENFSVGGKGVSIVYESEDQVSVTDAYEKERECLLTETGGRKRVSTITDGPGGAGGFPYSENNVVSWIYDDQMRPTEVEYAGGAITQFLNYDDRGNPGTVKLAVGTPEEKAITYTYHPNMNVKLSRTESSVLGRGNKETIWDYDNDYDTTPNENPTKFLSRIIDKGYTKDTSEDIIPYEYTTTFTYNSKGQVLSIDGPLPGSDDTISFTYDPTTGNLLSITRPLIGATTFSNYDAAGYLGRITDVNGQSKSFSYDGRGRITTITNDADQSTTTFNYTTAGQPVSMTDPDGINKSFDYDIDYGRLIRITDPEGNYMAYGYDSQGNRIEKSKHKPSGECTLRKRWSFQHRVIPGKLWKEINPDDTFIEYGYDSAGNISSITNPLGNTTTYNYNSLNRLKMVTQPGSVITSYVYDKHGNLIKVTDAEDHETTYQYDDIGRMISTTSPDTGTVTYVYDEAGNLIQKTDAKGIIVTYTYDSLNRLIATHFPDPSQDITYTYDGSTYDMGRLTRMTDPSGSITFAYDNRGRLIEKTSTINGHDFIVTHTYTPGNRLSSIIYPTGRTVTYNRNTTGKISGVFTTHNGNTTTLLDNLPYLPFGPATSMDMGSSSVNNVFDELYRMTVANPGAETERTYTYDANGNITNIQVTNSPWKNQTFTYDPLNRLIEAGGIYGTVSYTYDKVGNRHERTVNDQTENYTYAIGTNKLNEITGVNPVTFTYDANGNTIGMGNKTFIYNQNNRLIRSEEEGNTLGEYIYNGLGQRAMKQESGATTIFHYDLNGNIIIEGLSDGTFTSEYIYMGTSRLAKVDTSDNAIYYYLNDHLGTPQIMTDESGTVVWEATYKPFGEASVNPNSTILNNFRLPGQFFDEETGLHYNYFRDYHPGIGRYIEPDPLHLGNVQIARQNFQTAFVATLLYQYGLFNPHVLNLHTYVLNNPVNSTDQWGLFGIFGPGFTNVRPDRLFAPPEFDPRLPIGLGPKLHKPIPGQFVFGIPGAIVTSEPVKRTGVFVFELGLTLVGTGLEIGTTIKTIEQIKEIIYGEAEAAEGYIVSTLPDSWQYDPSWFPELLWDPNNPETIARSSSATISVTGGTPPYTWSVSGNGFSLAETETQGLSNTLIADSTACGTATITITVIDDCGQSVTSDVRCTAGVWMLQGQCLARPVGEWGWCETISCPSFVYIEGGSKWTHIPACSCQSTTFVWKDADDFISPCPWPIPPCGSPHDCWSGSCSSVGCSSIVGGFSYIKWVCP